MDTPPPEVEMRDMALSNNEYQLLHRLNDISVWLATKPMEDVINLCMSELGLDLKAARKWIEKAQDYLSLGAIENAGQARERYYEQLNDLYSLARSNAVKDGVEVTTKPVRVEAVETDGEVKHRVIRGEIIKVKQQQFDSAAARIAFQAAQEMAVLTGVRRRGGGMSVGQMNVQVNNHGAQTVDELCDEELAEIVGLKVDAKALPEPAEEAA